MFSARGWQKFFNLNLDFWFFLPILGIAFWMGGEFLTDRVLSRSYNTTDEVEADTNTQVQLAFNVVLIQVQIDRDLGFTQVEVKTNDSDVKTLSFTGLTSCATCGRRQPLLRGKQVPAPSALKKLEFEFAVTQFEQIETIIARELGLSREDVQKLARYELKN
jgi:hypothetical protein